MKFKSLLLFLSLSFFAHAQIIEYGVLGGVNLNSLEFDANPNQNSAIKFLPRNEYGFHLGAFARLNIAMFYVQSELDFSFLQGSVLADINDGNTPDVKEDYQLKRMDIPVNLGFKLGPASIFAGPVFSNIIGTRDDFISKNAEDFTVGGNAGINFLIQSVMLQARYEFPFSNFADEVTLPSQSGDINFQVDSRIPMFVFSVGLKLN